MRTVLPVLLAATLGLGAAGLAACGDNNKLFDPAEADAIKSDLDAVGSAVSDQDCNAADTAALKARDQVNRLGSDVPSDVQRALDDKLAELRDKAVSECEDAINSTTSETTPATTESTPSDTNSTPTESTPTESTPTQSTPSTPTQSTPTAPPTTLPVPPSNGGGITAPQGAGQ